MFNVLINFPKFDEFLRKGLELLDADTKKEIENFIVDQQHESGAFIDKAGTPDIYYSVFGYFVAKAMKLEQVLLKLKKYVHQIDVDLIENKIDLFCTGILFSELLPKDKRNTAINAKIHHEIKNKSTINETYKNFLGFVSLFYSKKYFKLIVNIIKHFRNKQANKNILPSSILSAEIVMHLAVGKSTKDLVSELSQLYGPNGGFFAIPKAPVEDLLSTAVSLFALNLADTDLSLIRAKSLEYVDSLYEEGGFVANVLEHAPDIEYTFYGLLAVSSLQN